MLHFQDINIYGTNYSRMPFTGYGSLWIIYRWKVPVTESKITKLIESIKLTTGSTQIHFTFTTQSTRVGFEFVGFLCLHRGHTRICHFKCALIQSYMHADRIVGLNQLFCVHNCANATHTHSQIDNSTNEFIFIMPPKSLSKYH